MYLVLPGEFDGYEYKQCHISISTVIFTCVNLLKPNIHSAVYQEQNIAIVH